MTKHHGRECGNCNAFNPNLQANPKAGEARQGWCVAKPPVCMQVQVSTLAGPQAGLQGVWPPTFANQWCREFSPAAKESSDD